MQCATHVAPRSSLSGLSNSTYVAPLVDYGLVSQSTAFPEPECDQAGRSDEKWVRAGALTVRNERDAGAARTCCRKRV